MIATVHCWWSDRVMAELIARRLPQPVVAMDLEGERIVVGVTAVTPTPTPPPLEGADWIHLGKGMLVAKKLARD